MDLVPISVALVAGALAVLNPCGFPLLPAFLSFYLGAEEGELPRAATRVLQGLLVGALVAAGFVGLFVVVGLPVSLGVGAIAEAVPWVGLATGVVLAAVGVLALFGARVHLPFAAHLRPRRERRAGAMVLFGVGYGTASLGCTLPLFLTLVGASLGGTQLLVFAAYGLGMTVLLMTLSVGVALLRDGTARFLRPILPHMTRISGALLVVAGAYLTYYWLRVTFGDAATLAGDPVVGVVSRYAAETQVAAQEHAGPLLALAAAVLALAASASLWRRHSTARRTADR